MAWTHAYGLNKGLITNLPPTMISPRSISEVSGCTIKEGVIQSDHGTVNYPVPGDTKTNALNGIVMATKQFGTLSGLNFAIAMTTTCLYQYNTGTTTWDVIARGLELDDCEAAWDAQANVTSTTDDDMKMRDTKAAKHVIAAGFGTGIVSSEDDLQNTDISDAINTHLSFWVRSDTAIAADVLAIRLSEQAAGGVGATYADYNIPAIVADTWQHVILAIASPDASNGGTYPDDLNALASVALIANSDPGAVTIYLDDIRSIQAFTGGADNRFSTGTLNDTFIITNGINNIIKVTETGGVLTAAALSTSLAAGTISTSEIVLIFKDHVVFLNNTENGADAPQRASWGNIGATEDYTGGTAGYQDLVDDPGWINAAVMLNENEAVVYKENAVVKMTWIGGQTPFRFKTMVDGIGAISKDAVASFEGKHTVVGESTIYAYFGGTEIQAFDKNIKGRFFSSLDRDNMERSFSFYNERDTEVQIWIPTNTTYPDQVWCYHTLDQSWYIKDRSMMGFGFYVLQSSITIGELIGNIGEQNYRIGDALGKASSEITLVGDENGKVYQVSYATLDDADVAITNTFETPDFILPDTPDYLNKFMRVNQLIYEASGQSVTTAWSGDGGLTWSPTLGAGENTVSLDSLYRYYQQDFDTVTRKIRFRFRNTSAASGFKIRYYGFYWLLRSGRK